MTNSASSIDALKAQRRAELRARQKEAVRKLLLRQFEENALEHMETSERTVVRYRELAEMWRLCGLGDPPAFATTPARAAVSA